MTAELAPKTNNNEKIIDQSAKQPENEFSWFEEQDPHPHIQGVDTNIKERLAPEPLSIEKKEELLKLALSNESNEDVLKFVEKKAELSRFQQDEFDDYRRNMHLLETRFQDPERFKAELADLNEKQQADFRAFEVEDKARTEQKIAEARTNPQAEEDRLLLYSQKLQAPTEYQENYKSLGVTQQVKFKRLERAEDKTAKAAIEKGSNDITVPELTMDGEVWITDPTREASEMESKIEQDRLLDQNYLASAYRDSQSADPRVLQAFSREAQGWTEEQRTQYVAYSNAQKQQAEWTKASKPTVWSKVKRFFRGRK